MAEQAAVEHEAQVAAEVVGEAPHEEALARTAALHERDDAEIGECEREHGVPRRCAAYDGGEALRHLALEIRPGGHACVVDEACHGHEQQIAPFRPDIAGEALRAAQVGWLRLLRHIISLPFAWLLSL